MEIEVLVLEVERHDVERRPRRDLHRPPRDLSPRARRDVRLDRDGQVVGAQLRGLGSHPRPAVALVADAARGAYATLGLAVERGRVQDAARLALELVEVGEGRQQADGRRGLQVGDAVAAAEPGGEVVAARRDDGRAAVVRPHEDAAALGGCHGFLRGGGGFPAVRVGGDRGPVQECCARPLRHRAGEAPGDDPGVAPTPPASPVRTAAGPGRPASRRRPAAARRR